VKKQFGRWSRTVLVGTVAVAAACVDSQVLVQPLASPLAGLAPGVTNDSNPIVSPPLDASPGSFRGVVTGHVVLDNVTDTISLTPTIAGAHLTAYLQIAPSPSDTLGIGPAMATVMTDANGQFQFPMLDGGLYFVTVTPPSGSPYQGVWVIAVAQSHSEDYPWRVELSSK
jgi:hypothetical protein